jgi:hypothetical protein
MAKKNASKRNRVPGPVAPGTVARRVKAAVMREAKRARAYDEWMEKHFDEPWSGLSEGSSCPPCGGFWGSMGTVGKVIVLLISGGVVVGVANAFAGRKQ